MNAVETAVSARAEKGSGHHEGPGSSEAIGSLLNPANDSFTRFSSLFLMNLAFPSRYRA